MMKWRFLEKNEGCYWMRLIWSCTKMNLLNHTPIDLIWIQYVPFYSPFIVHDL